LSKLEEDSRKNAAAGREMAAPTALFCSLFISLVQCSSHFISPFHYRLSNPVSRQEQLRTKSEHCHHLSDNELSPFAANMQCSFQFDLHMFSVGEADIMKFLAKCKSFYKCDKGTNPFEGI
jgi:hypothetical protein